MLLSLAKGLEVLPVRGDLQRSQDSGRLGPPRWTRPLQSGQASPPSGQELNIMGPSSPSQLLWDSTTLSAFSSCIVGS